MIPGPDGRPDTAPEAPTSPAHEPDVAAEFRGLAGAGRRMPTAIAIGALAVVVVAFAAKLAEPSAVVVPGPATPRPSAAAVGVAPSSPLVASDAVPPGRDPLATPHPFTEISEIDPGTVRIVPAGPTSVRVTASMGGGWMTVGDGTYLFGTDDENGMSVGAWAVSRVPIYPCRWASGEFAEAARMRSAEGQAHALSSWWGQDSAMPADSNDPIAPVATRPEPSDIGGYPAWHLEVLIPSGFDFDDCDGGELVLWETATGEVRPGLTPGEIIGIWVADVDGEPIVIAASKTLRASPETSAAIAAVVASIEIEPGG